MPTLRTTCPELDSLAGPLESLLISGGDSRLSVNPITMANRYGCRPRPRPEVFTFASSTATNISSRGFAAAAEMRQRLLHSATDEELADACTDQADQLRSEIRTILKLDQSVDIVFSPSGTDSEIHAVYLAQTLLSGSSQHAQGFVSVIVAADETGCGVAQASLGHHFSSATAQGAQVVEGQQIPGLASGFTSMAIPVRDSSGAVRSLGALDGEVVAAVGQAVAKGKRVILHTMDSSKFGWRGPSLHCLLRIQNNWGPSVQVVVDACQLRLGRQRLAYYLDQGFLVLITGSKYFTGPPFSGALLVPAAASRRFEQFDVLPDFVANGLKLYSSRNDWPVRWRAIRSALAATPNIGQLLRWAAAVEEMRAYFAVPAAYRSLALRIFSSTMLRLFAARPNLQLLPACPSLNADPLDEDEMANRTIFPFFLRREGKLLSPDECGRIYRALNWDVSYLLPSPVTASRLQVALAPCHLGHPVTVLHPVHGAVGTLRISASARVVSDTWCSTGEADSLARLNQHLDQLPLIFDKIDLLLEKFDQLDSNPAKMTSQTLITAAAPPAPICFARLFKKAFDGEDLKPLRDQLIARLRSDSAAAAAADLLSLCTIEQLLGDPASGLARQAQALSAHRLYRSSWPASPNALRVLAFKAPGDVSTNTPIEFLLENSDVVLYSLYLVPGQPLPELPDHDVAIVTVGESDENRPILDDLEQLIQTWPCPVLNHPGRAARLSREGMYSLLEGIPGLVMPPTVRISRPDLEKLGRGLRLVGHFLERANFPLIARPIGSHGGRGLVKLESANAIAAYLSAQPETEFSLSPYVDYCSHDGQFRKYRIFWIDGHPYPGHMAISSEWKVWYYTAGMANSPAKRAEEAEFMSAFDKGFGRRHAAAFQAIAERIGLEYFGVDCAELPDGRLLVFEGGICLVVHDLDAPDLYPYKSPPMQKSFASFYNMLTRKSISGQKHFTG